MVAVEEKAHFQQIPDAFLQDASQPGALCFSSLSMQGSGEVLESIPGLVHPSAGTHLNLVTLDQTLHLLHCTSHYLKCERSDSSWRPISHFICSCFRFGWSSSVSETLAVTGMMMQKSSSSALHVPFSNYTQFFQDFIKRILKKTRTYKTLLTVRTVSWWWGLQGGGVNDREYYGMWEMTESEWIKEKEGGKEQAGRRW